METKREYIAPELTVVTFKTERGYGASDISLTSLRVIANAFTPNINSNQEVWTSEEELFDSGTSWDIFN